MNDYKFLYRVSLMADTNIIGHHIIIANLS